MLDSKTIQSVAAELVKSVLEAKDSNALRLTLLRLPDLTLELRRTIVEKIVCADQKLQCELVITPSDHPFGATRTLPEWQLENSNLTTLKSALTGISAESAEATVDQAKELFSVIITGLAINDSALISLMKVHFPPDWHILLTSCTPSCISSDASVIFLLWDYPRNVAEHAEYFLEALKLEKVNPGKGVEKIRLISGTTLGMNLSPAAESSVGFKPFALIRGALADLWAKLTEDRFHLPGNIR